MKLKPDLRLNGICPYFTMFPLDFPLGVLRRGSRGDVVLDPFAGRGTTNYAARVLGMPTVGIDSSPVAAALTEAKLANTTAQEVVRCAERILSSTTEPADVPSGEFWTLAYHHDVLRQIVALRNSLIKNASTPARRGLRGVVMGALHGPLTKHAPSHLSNQCPRSYAPKPAYAVKFWREKGLRPPDISVIEVVRRRAERYFGRQLPAVGNVIRGDSREHRTFIQVKANVRWIITSPPYYGLRTYVPDQWLRNWFVGGAPSVEYSSSEQLSHASPQAFSNQLHQVWENIAEVSYPDAKMVVRFGGINDRSADPRSILRESFREGQWRIDTVVAAGSAEKGKRQADHFARTSRRASEEFDMWLSRR